MNIIANTPSFIVADKPGNIVSVVDTNHTVSAQTLLEEQLDIPLFKVHRLDKPTTGLIMFAKSEQSQEKIAKLFKDRKITKKYFAVVNKPFLTEDVHLNLPLSRDENNHLRRKVKGDGKNAESVFKIIRNNDEYQLLDVNLLTGRTHQIRAHLRYLRTEIANDTLYDSYRDDNVPPEEIGLQAYHLEFNLEGELHSFDIDYRFNYLV